MNIQNTIDNKLRTIVRILEETVKNDDELGLFNGKAGQSIIFFVLTKFLNKQKYYSLGETLIEEICDRSESIRTVDYAGGLAGIGWAIEWLVQNDLMDVEDTHDILESIDKVIYKYIAYTKIEDISLDKGICGILKYLSRRIRNKTSNAHRYTLLGHLEGCLILTDDLLEFIELALESQSNNKLGIIMLANTLRTVLDLDIPVNQSTIEKINKKLILNIEDVLRNETPRYYGDEDLDLLLNHSYLATSYLAAAKKRGLKMHEMRANEYLKILITRFSLINSNPEELNLKKLSILTLVNFYFPNEIIKEIIIKAINHGQINNLSAKLHNGLGVAIIADLSTNNENLGLDISELLFVI
ncbi:lanthionine synthetase LanC family protein [Sphingobacterium paludis]|uniref:Lanthionine synthetase-like protein n=1 Tax=Sphingobacterium paludis TaxID=1476465 RepID=A0A4R7CWD8_9SPHI|nr:lanthionine synthetase LanC family protein [Sphingobacterium paludis]TDS12152.1 lanthionine synthetase-like protein [Sphingobacterium paludis]